ncbi:MAG: uracil-DNA glycosylase [Desulfobulbaceae bacterium]|nr:uracil-DNA glycosylase [Desulfobulbaceae bacterium]
MLRHLYALVQYHRSCGLVGYRCKKTAEKALHELASLAATSSPLPKAVPAAQAPGLPSGAEAVAARQARPDLRHITAEINGCRNCPLHQERVVATPGRGALRPKVLIVGEWLCIAKAQSVPAGTLFGIEEDRMLERMTAAIGLSADDVFVTNIIKCGVPDTVQPAEEQAIVCAAYTKRQIEMLTPVVVLAMGTIAARIMTGIERPLSVLRGRVSGCRLASGEGLPLVATYHPSFLLQNPEMKQAAWTDLQLVLKTLRQQDR